MLRKITTWKALALAVAILCSVACDSNGPAGEQAVPVELRSYQVPEGHKSEIASQLRYVLQGSEESAVGRVTGGSGDSLIVVAPPGIHEGVQALLRDLEKLGPVPPPTQVRLTYWVVSGRPTEVGVTPDRPYATTGPARLGQIEPALAGIAEAQGPTEFRLLERIELVSRGHDRAKAFGQVVRVSQRATVSGEVAVAEVEINLGGASLGIETEVVFRPGQYLVLGQGGVPYTHMRETQELQAPDATLYYVVAADF